MKKGKKGQIGGLPSIVLTILFALIFLAIAFIFIQEILDNDNLSDTGATGSANNVWINSTGYTLSEASTELAFNSPGLTTVYNATEADDNVKVVQSGNWTVYSNGTITNATSLVWDDVNITYSYLYGESSFAAVNDTLAAFGEIPSLVGLLILVIMIGIVIAVVTGMAGGRVGTGA